MQLNPTCSQLTHGRQLGVRPFVPCTRSSPISSRCRPQQRDVSTGALAIDWSSAQTWGGLAVGLGGLVAGIGIPAFFVKLQSDDESRLEELRELNRQTFKETGEYLTEDELAKIRNPRWTDRRVFQDDD